MRKRRDGKDVATNDKMDRQVAYKEIGRDIDLKTQKYRRYKKYISNRRGWGLSSLPKLTPMQKG